MAGLPQMHLRNDASAYADIANRRITIALIILAVNIMQWVAEAPNAR